MAHAPLTEYANLLDSRAGVLRELEEARAVSRRLGTSCVIHTEDGWRPFFRNAHDRAARLRAIAAEMSPAPDDQAARRRAHLANLALDLKVDRLRARRRLARDQRTVARAPVSSSPRRMLTGVRYRWGFRPGGY